MLSQYLYIVLLHRLLMHLPRQTACLSPSRDCFCQKNPLFLIYMTTTLTCCLPAATSSALRPKSSLLMSNESSSPSHLSGKWRQPGNERRGEGNEDKRKKDGYPLLGSREPRPLEETLSVCDRGRKFRIVKFCDRHKCHTLSVTGKKLVSVSVWNPDLNGSI